MPPTSSTTNPQDVPALSKPDQTPKSQTARDSKTMPLMKTPSTNRTAGDPTSSSDMNYRVQQWLDQAPHDDPWTGVRYMVEDSAQRNKDMQKQSKKVLHDSVPVRHGIKQSKCVIAN